MNIIIYYIKKDFDTQKALRFFKERKVKVQEIDAVRAPLTVNMLRNIKRSAGDVVDRESLAFRESPARFSGSEDSILESAAQNNKMLRFPIVRNGNQAVIGFQPDIFEKWLNQ
jgi:arsenate reductase-like glutaredoxin family protein